MTRQQFEERVRELARKFNMRDAIDAALSATPSDALQSARSADWSASMEQGWHPCDLERNAQFADTAAFWQCVYNNLRDVQ